MALVPMTIIVAILIVGGLYFKNQAKYFAENI